MYPLRKELPEEYLENYDIFRSSTRKAFTMTVKNHFNSMNELLLSSDTLKESHSL